jgi:hypothetical protein
LIGGAALGYCTGFLIGAYFDYAVFIVVDVDACDDAYAGDCVDFYVVDIVVSYVGD